MSGGFSELPCLLDNWLGRAHWLGKGRGVADFTLLFADRDHFARNSQSLSDNSHNLLNS
jgi:hypothetical protein